MSYKVYLATINKDPLPCGEAPGFGGDEGLDIRNHISPIELEGGIWALHLPENTVKACLGLSVAEVLHVWKDRTDLIIDHLTDSKVILVTGGRAELLELRTALGGIKAAKNWLRPLGIPAPTPTPEHFVIATPRPGEGAENEVRQRLLRPGHGEEGGVRLTSSALGQREGEEHNMNVTTIDLGRKGRGAKGKGKHKPPSATSPDPPTEEGGKGAPGGAGILSAQDILQEQTLGPQEGDLDLPSQDGPLLDGDGEEERAIPLADLYWRAREWLSRPPQEIQVIKDTLQQACTQKVPEVLRSDLKIVLRTALSKQRGTELPPLPEQVAHARAMGRHALDSGGQEALRHALALARAVHLSVTEQEQLRQELHKGKVADLPRPASSPTGASRVTATVAEDSFPEHELTAGERILRLARSFTK